MRLLRTGQLVLWWCNVVLLLVECHSTETSIRYGNHKQSISSISRQTINRSTSEQSQSVSTSPQLRPNCANLVQTSATSNHSIKSISFYLDQVVLLYGNTNDSSSIYLYRYRPNDSTIADQSVPLSGLNFEHADVIEDGPLVELFEDVKKYVDKCDIVQLVYVHQDMVIIFFRDPWEVFFVTFFRGKKVQQDKVVSVTGLVSHSVLLYHLSEDTTDNNGTNVTIPTYFITLDDPSYQEGTMNLSVSDGVVHLSSHHSRLFGTSKQASTSTLKSTTTGQPHVKLYLVIDEHKQTYSDLMPLHSLLNMQMWRAALFHSHLYLLSGHKSGRVFYFKAENLSSHDSHLNLVMSMGNMSYGHFFGCRRETPSRGEGENAEVVQGEEEVAIFAPEDVLEHADGWDITFFFSQYYLIALVAMIILLVIIIIICCCRPSQRITRTPTSTSLTTQSQNTQSQIENSDQIDLPNMNNSESVTQPMTTSSDTTQTESSQSIPEQQQQQQEQQPKAKRPRSVKSRRHGYNRCHCSASQAYGHCRSESPSTIDPDSRSLGPQSPASIRIATLTTPSETRLHHSSTSSSANFDI